MPCCKNLSKEIRECLRRAEECNRLAEAALTESGRADYLDDMERRWLSLARSYEFAERLSRFTEPHRKENGEVDRAASDAIAPKSRGRS
jgi:hypothetical protein